ncbi:MAG: PIN domain-containing protein [Nitrospirae bacterium]|nr:PIN domain-containing protein [Nitrospirota bacterium]
MDKDKKPLIFIDTNVFLLDLRYTNDVNYKHNRKFLDNIMINGGITSIINLLEVCGILSYNLNQQQLKEFFYYFPQRYNLEIVPTSELNSTLPEFYIKDIMETIYQKSSFGDAMIINAIKPHITKNSLFITWDAKHFKDALPIRVITPIEFLKSLS